MNKDIIAALEADLKDRQVEHVEDAGLMYLEYAELARVADRGKNRAKRSLSGYDAGEYGEVRIRYERVNRVYLDEDAIRAIFAKHGLGEVPTKLAEPSLRVEFVEPEAGDD